MKVKLSALKEIMTDRTIDRPTTEGMLGYREVSLPMYTIHLFQN